MKAIMFVACEKVIVATTGSTSIIGILQTVSVGQIGEESIPANAVGPKEWALVAMWRPAHNDVGQTFNQVFEIFLPDGSSFAKSNLSFTVMSEQQALNYIQLNAMPLGKTGFLIIKAWVEDQCKQVSEQAEFRVEIVHHAPATPS